MEINQKKLERQLGIVEKWVKNTGAKGTLEACTGFGKTFTAILAIKRFRKKYPVEPINVVVPSIDLKSQWLQVLSQNAIEHVTVWVVNSYIKHKHQVALLILDEVHRFFSDEFFKVFEYTEYQLILCLSATVERSDGKHSLLDDIAPVFDIVTLEEAKREGYISEYSVINWGLKFNKEDSENYNKYHSTFNNNFAYFHRDFELAMTLTKSDKAYVEQIDHKGLKFKNSIASIRENFAKTNGWNGEDFIEDAGDAGTNYYHPKTVRIKAMQWLNAMHMRRKLIYVTSAKLDAIEQLVKLYPDRKIIIFSENSEFADEVQKRLGSECKAFHTKLKTEERTIRVETFLKSGKVKVVYKKMKFGLTRLRKEIIENFKAGLFRILSVVKAVDEGLDDEDIDMAIMASYNSTIRQDTQRTGRAVRVKEDKHSLVINLYMIDSQEEKWLKSKQSNKTNITWVKSIDEVLAVQSLSLI